MAAADHCLFFILVLFMCYSYAYSEKVSETWNDTSKELMREKVLEMFYHAYNSYMVHAFPGDELMPLSCKGRYRGSEADRGDIDEALGNFSLTLIDSLDTLAVLGNIPEFEKAARLVIATVSFDTDVVVSVFETNIRVLGGLLGAHTVAMTLKEAGKGMLWYRNELLDMAVDIGNRLLVAFNTSTHIPFPKVNLKYGVYNSLSRVGHEQDTCTACAGTMIMEFAALSRLSGNPLFEEKAHKAMEAIWHYRSRHSDLVGTVINIHNGDWVRRDSGIGAGIDSYYEYCLKAYVLLGDESYLAKFNKHYSAINKYIRQGSMMLDVLMHQPEKPVRTFMDALQAFWPGLQVLLGDLKPAIETHEMLYEVAKRHKFLPEAFTSNLDVYWGQHPLRPELAESTYFLYEATKDPYYLDVGKHIIEAMQDYARVPCGFAAVKDVRTLSHEDKMDSFVLAETFKYLYLLFSSEEHRIINVHDFLFTTEAHLLPLTLSNLNSSGHAVTHQVTLNHSFAIHTGGDFSSTCPNRLSYQNMPKDTEEIRKKVRIVNQGTCPTTKQKILESYVSLDPTREPKLRAEHFQVGNKEHLKFAKDMGITITITEDGRVQLMHQAALALTVEDAQDGIKFMQDMIQLAKTRGEKQGNVKPRVVQLMSEPYKDVIFSAGAAQFGVDLEKHDIGITSRIVEASPLKACRVIDNKDTVRDKIVLLERGDCMFIDKVRQMQNLGALGVIIMDHNEGTSSETQPAFAMSGDSHSGDVSIPSVFLFRKEGQLLQTFMKEVGANHNHLVVRIGAKAERKSMGILNNEGQPSGNASTVDGHQETKSEDDNYVENSSSEGGEYTMSRENWDPSGKESDDRDSMEHRITKNVDIEDQYNKIEGVERPKNFIKEEPFCFGDKETNKLVEESKSHTDAQIISSSIEEQLRQIHLEVEKIVESLRTVNTGDTEAVTDDNLETVLGLGDVYQGTLFKDESTPLKGKSKGSESVRPVESSQSSVFPDESITSDDTRTSANKLHALNEEYDKANAASIERLQERASSERDTESGEKKSEMVEHADKLEL